MNKRNIFLISFIALVVSASLFVFFNNDMAKNKNEKVLESKPAAQQNNISSSEQVTQEPITPGTYNDYSEDAFNQSTGQRVLFFYAPWCFQCREVDKDLKQETIPAGFDIFKVDYDSRQDLRQKYGVTFRTAFVKVDSAGNKIGDEYIAYNDPSLAAVIREFLLK